MYFTYILENPIGKMYIGQTNNTGIRLNWHNAGKSKYTKGKGPWKLIYTKEFKTRSEAIKYESYLKRLKNPVYIKRSIIGS